MSPQYYSAPDDAHDPGVLDDDEAPPVNEWRSRRSPGAMARAKHEFEKVHGKPHVEARCGDCGSPALACGICPSCNAIKTAMGDLF